ncbi:MAG: hypothetical protein MRY21_03075 [Simkaniaceae bacterium]|nr:hypothetical protein [Simkaniaceae bacterium]
MKKAYYDGEYSSDHWAMEVKTWEEHPGLIAKAKYENSEYTFYLNPTDKRGYRSIVTLTDSCHPGSVFNRDYTPEERIGLGLFIQLVADVYSQIVPIAQTAVAGNNSHSFNMETGITYIGSSHEPSMLHGHVIGRGNPECAYIGEVKLDGPVPGQLFDMRAKTPEIKGNDRKVKWAKGEMQAVAARIGSELEKLKAQYERQGLVIITE